jgi:4-hydroxy-3-methylbut-2-enyl diphosphate reductase
MGEAPEAIILVEDCKDVDKLSFDSSTKLAYLTQTTLSVDDANRIIARLKERFPWILGPHKEDICYATQNRQEAVKLLCQTSDLVIVLGSQNSSNSQRLCELAKEFGKPAYLIDGPSDLKPEWFFQDQKVFITAGASAPESVVQSTIEWLQARYSATLREDVVRKEEVHFPLPKALREIARQTA